MSKELLHALEDLLSMPPTHGLEFSQATVRKPQSLRFGEEIGIGAAA
jgi:hypothetical protein